MDFKSLLDKIESIDGKIETPAAPIVAKAVQLNEDAQLRVLSGRTTYVAEVAKQAETVKEAAEKQRLHGLIQKVTSILQRKLKVKNIPVKKLRKKKSPIRKLKRIH